MNEWKSRDWCLDSHVRADLEMNEWKVGIDIFDSHVRAPITNEWMKSRNWCFKKNKDSHVRADYKWMNEK